jgi:hypothetical protein
MVRTFPNSFQTLSVEILYTLQEHQTKLRHTESANFANYLTSNGKCLRKTEWGMEGNGDSQVGSEETLPTIEGDKQTRELPKTNQYYPQHNCFLSHTHEIKLFGVQEDKWNLLR